MVIAWSQIPHVTSQDQVDITKLEAFRQKHKAEIQAELDAEMQKADAEIAAKTAESEAAIAEIREGALKSVTDVAKDTAKELVAAMGGSADAKAITAAVNARMKG